MNLFYRPELAAVGDVIPFYDHGVFKPFYLRNYRNNMDAEHHDSWVMLSTTDHLHFEEHDTKIDAATGSVVFHDGMYHMFATLFKSRPMKNVIIHAVSPDLDAWTILDDTLMSDNAIYEEAHFRDPFVFWNEEDACWWMIMAAREKGPTLRRGCVGLCKSDDLVTWRHCPPLYSPEDANCCFECPDFFRWGDWYYIVFSSYSDRYQTLYRMSRSPNGPWITPRLDTFDSRAFYAAKTASDGKQRFIYGWNPTREINEHHFDPRKEYGTDNHTWDWGGHLIVHELIQQEDGTLYVKPVEAVNHALTGNLPIDFRPLQGSWEKQPEALSINACGTYACALLGRLPKLCRIHTDITFSDKPLQIGIALGVDETFTRGNYILLEPRRGRLQYKTSLRTDPQTGNIFPWEVESERPIALEPKVRHSLTLFRQDDVLVIYLDDAVALSTRMYQDYDGQIGLFAEDCSASFSHSSIHIQSTPIK